MLCAISLLLARYAPKTDGPAVMPSNTPTISCG
jgi:hypothetical protein